MYSTTSGRQSETAAAAPHLALKAKRMGLSVGPILMRLMVKGEGGEPALDEGESVPDSVVPHALVWRYGGGVVQWLGK